MAAVASQIAGRTNNVYLDALLHNGWRWNGTITYFFDTEYTVWMEAEKTAYRSAFQSWADVALIDFHEVGAKQDANFIEESVPNSYFSDSKDITFGRHQFPDQGNNISQGCFNYQAYSVQTDGGATRYDTTGLVVGGQGYENFIHELGHGLGLSHPHDGPNGKFPGVKVSSDLGGNNLNQVVYTVMSYNEFEQVAGDSSYGYAAGPSAFDIAAIQFLYGARASHQGNDVYVLPSADGGGTYWRCVWDTGGSDEIRYNGSGDATIDLWPATLDNSAGAGGWLSSAIDPSTHKRFHGGFTIANGVVIEKATGGSGNDTITGNDAANILRGGLGNDVLDGGLGIDTADYRDSLTGVSVDLFNGTGFGGTAQGDKLIDIEKVIGSNYRDTLTAGFFSAGLYGGAGDDRLYEGGSRAELNGGSGNDDYFFYYGKGNAVEAAGGGHDTVYSPGRTVLTPNVEDLVLTGVDNVNGFGNALGNHLTGNSGNNYLQGFAGWDTLEGGAGNDYYELGDLNSLGSQFRFYTYDTVIEAAGAGIDTESITALDNPLTFSSRDGFTLDANIENGILQGTRDFDLTGNALDNVLTGNIGSNRLNGGVGNDTVSYANANGAEIVDLSAGGTKGGGGSDTLLSIENVIGSRFADTITGDAGDNILTGGLGADHVDGGAGIDTADYGDSAQGINITVNSPTAGVGGTAAGDKLVNIENLAGSAFDDWLFGDAGANSLSGRGGNDILKGGGGADTLTGGLGADHLDGGDGIDTADYGDSTQAVNITVNSPTAGVGGTAAGDKLVNIENLAGSAFGDTLAGDGGANSLSGMGGSDTLKGGGGADHLDGGAGVDQASYADSSAAVTIDLSAGTGSGGDAEGDTLVDIENVSGSRYNDRLTGDDNSNTLSGGSDGNDTFDGGGGLDTLIGGVGNDTYILDSVTRIGRSYRYDSIVEDGVDALKRPGGIDTVIVTAFANPGGYTLGANVENGTIAGKASFDLTGNELDNVLVGNGAANEIRGGAGKDTLNGGGGADGLSGGDGHDTFVFTTTPNTLTNDPTIADFTVSGLSSDIIALSHAIYAALPTGNVSSSNFTTGPKATNTSQHLIYNAGTGGLLYDADGSGGGAAVQLAKLSPGLALSAAQFQVIA